MHKSLEADASEAGTASLRTVRGDPHEEGLGAYTEVDPYLAVGIADVLESTDPVARHEVRDGTFAVLGSNSHKRDVGIVLRCLCDRTSFSDTERSPRSPEPKHHVLALK